MQIDFTAPVLSFDGLPVLGPSRSPEEPEGSPYRLGDACLSAVHTVGEADRTHVGYDESLRRGLLGRRIYRALRSGQPVDLVAEDIAFLKVCLGKAYAHSPIVLIGAVELLDPAAMPA